MRYVKLMIIAWFITVLCLVTCKSLAESNATPTKVENKSEVKTEKAIPQARLKELQQYFQRPNAKTQAEFSQKMRAQMAKALAVGGELEKEYE